jgi:hypothetical protein
LPAQLDEHSSQVTVHCFFSPSRELNIKNYGENIATPYISEFPQQNIQLHNNLKNTKKMLKCLNIGSHSRMKFGFSDYDRNGWATYLM